MNEIVTQVFLIILFPRNVILKARIYIVCHTCVFFFCFSFKDHTRVSPGLPVIQCLWLCNTHRTNFFDILQTQEAALQRILQANHLSEHGRNHKLNQYKSRREFINGFPLTEYSHYEEYIEKISNGKQNVLTGDDVVFLATTSGTTGKNKAYPLTPSYMRDAKRVLLEVCIHVCSNYYIDCVICHASLL